MKRNLTLRTRSGSFVCNDTFFALLNADLPFGGTGDSGYGYIHSELGFKDMSNNRVIVERPVGRKNGIEFAYPSREKNSDQVIKFLKEKETKLNMIPEDFKRNVYGVLAMLLV